MAKLYKQKEIEIVHSPPKNVEEAISILVDKYTSTINKKIIDEINNHKDLKITRL